MEMLLIAGLMILGLVWWARSSSMGDRLRVIESRLDVDGAAFGDRLASLEAEVSNLRRDLAKLRRAPVADAVAAEATARAAIPAEGIAHAPALEPPKPFAELVAPAPIVAAPPAPAFPVAPPPVPQTLRRRLEPAYRMEPLPAAPPPLPQEVAAAAAVAASAAGEMLAPALTAELSPAAPAPVVAEPVAPSPWVDALSPVEREPIDVEPAGPSLLERLLARLGFEAPEPGGGLSFASIERWIEGRLFAVVGGIAILLGSVFGLSLAFSSGLITPTMQVGMGLIGGAVLMVLGELFFRRLRGILGHVLVAVGLAILEVAFLASTRLYGVLPVDWALAGAFLAAVAAAMIAIRHDSNWWPPTGWSPSSRPHRCWARRRRWSRSSSWPPR